MFLHLHYKGSLRWAATWQVIGRPQCTAIIGAKSQANVTLMMAEGEGDIGGCDQHLRL